ncbi:MAG TPA: pilin [Candidatus Paceibacterota bacterium]
MKKSIFFVSLLPFVLSVSLLPLEVSSAPSPTPSTFPLRDLKFNQVLTILNTLVSWLFTIFLIVAVIFIIFAAFRYLLSGGDPAAVKKATHMLIYAAIAIGVALLSVSVQFIVKQLVTGTGGSDFCNLPGNAGAPECRGPLPPFSPY